MDIYHDICILAVLSGMEIDKAKRLYSVDSGKVLSRLRHYRKDYMKNHGGNLPAFYKYIVGDESPDTGENNAHLEAPMAFVHDAADAFAGRAAYTRTLPVSELFELDPTDVGQNDTHKKQNIIKAVKDAHTKITAMQTAMKNASDDEKMILCEEANEVYQNALNEWVFYNPCNPNLPMNPAAAYQKLHTILKNAELPRIRFHDLRHTFATHATKGGVDPKTLSGILGHTNASFTLDTYTHVTGDMQKNAAAIVGGMVKKLKLEVE